MHEIRLPRQRRGVRTLKNYYKGVSFYSKMTETTTAVIPEGKIRDGIDSKSRNDTPEEYVRQTMESVW